jgi:hypothetical protein
MDQNNTVNFGPLVYSVAGGSGLYSEVTAIIEALEERYLETSRPAIL